MKPFASAVDLPRPRIEPVIGRRRHRRITGPAGAVLFLCMFLPAVKGCGEPVYPVSMPMFWHPYLYGLVLAAGAATATVRGLRYTTLAVRILAWLSIVGAALLVAYAPGIAVIELFIGACMLAAIGRRGGSERRLALTAILAGSLSLVWFGLWAAAPEALVGV
jgi:hypothetical protein